MGTYVPPQMWKNELKHWLDICVFNFSQNIWNILLVVIRIFLHCYKFKQILIWGIYEKSQIPWSNNYSCRYVF